MTPSQAFSSLVRLERSRRKLTQAEFSARCGLDRTYCSLLERGLRQPSLTTLYQVAHALEMSPVVLVRKLEIMRRRKRQYMLTRSQTR